MIYGMTGTRKGMSAAQKEWMHTLVGTSKGELIHGCAIGADEEAACIAATCAWDICGFPCNIQSQTSEDAIRLCNEFVAPPSPPLERNRPVTIVWPDGTTEVSS